MVISGDFSSKKRFRKKVILRLFWKSFVKFVFRKFWSKMTFWAILNKNIFRQNFGKKISMKMFGHDGRRDGHHDDDAVVMTAAKRLLDGGERRRFVGWRRSHYNIPKNRASFEKRFVNPLPSGGSDERGTRAAGAFPLPRRF